jgi:hypothetical protein
MDKIIYIYIYIYIYIQLYLYNFTHACVPFTINFLPFSTTLPTHWVKTQIGKPHPRAI